MSVSSEGKRIPVKLVGLREEHSQAQEQSTSTLRKLSRHIRKPAWQNRKPIIELQHKKGTVQKMKAETCQEHQEQQKKLLLLHQ